MSGWDGSAAISCAKVARSASVRVCRATQRRYASGSSVVIPAAVSSSSEDRRPSVRIRLAKVAIDRRTSAVLRAHSKRGSPKMAHAFSTPAPPATRVDRVTMTSSEGPAAGGRSIDTVCQRRSVQIEPGSIETVTSRRQASSRAAWSIGAAGTCTTIVNSIRGGSSCQTWGESAHSQTNLEPAGTVIRYSTPAGAWQSRASSARCRKLIGPIHRMASDSSPCSNHRRDGDESRSGSDRWRRWLKARLAVAGPFVASRPRATVPVVQMGWRTARAARVPACRIPTSQRRPPDAVI